MRVTLSDLDAERLGVGELEIAEDVAVILAAGGGVGYVYRSAMEPDALTDAQLAFWARLKWIAAEALRGAPADDMADRIGWIRSTGWAGFIVERREDEIHVEFGGRKLFAAPYAVFEDYTTAPEIEATVLPMEG